MRGSRDGLQVGVGEPGVVEAVDEGEEVGAGDAVGCEVGGVGAGEGAVDAAVEGVACFFLDVSVDVLVWGGT